MPKGNGRWNWLFSFAPFFILTVSKVALEAFIHIPLFILFPLLHTRLNTTYTTSTVSDLLTSFTFWKLNSHSKHKQEIYSTYS